MLIVQYIQDDCDGWVALSHRRPRLWLPVKNFSDENCSHEKPLACA
ncbi:hypothetical protein [[Phormidium] sp. ETS-05]|nr:hypothetical protein [[Phormidium] sp. ETS-05]